MGKGGNDCVIEVGTGLLGDLGAIAAPRSTVRSPKRGFVAEREEWKRNEKEFINNVLSELDTAIQDLAKDDAAWKAYLRGYVEMPRYSPLNIYWAQSQLRHRGTEEPGLIMSESAWKKLGRRVKAEYARPEAKRDKQYGYDRERDWDPKYAAEMTRPLGARSFERVVKDANGNPVLDKDGKPKKERIQGTPFGFAAMMVYHEAATEALDGGSPPPLPDEPWAHAEGSEKDAQELLNMLESKVFAGEGISLSFVAGSKDARSEGNQILIGEDLPTADKATLALREVFKIWDARDKRPSESDEDRQIRAAAAESAKYAIASLYKLDSEEQSFPHLSELAETDGTIKKVSSRVHKHVSKIVGYLDPERYAQVREGKTFSRAKKRKRQAKRKPAAAAA